MKNNLFAGIPESLPEELTEDLLRCDGVRIERIVSRGHASPPDFWYDQDEDEWVMVVQGRAGLEFDNETGEREVEMGPGNYVFIPAHRRHRVAWTAEGEDTVWLAVFLSSPG